MSCISHDGHCHEENEGNEKEEKKEKIEKILFIISILIFAFSFVLPVNNYIKGLRIELLTNQIVRLRK